MTKHLKTLAWLLSCCLLQTGCSKSVNYKFQSDKHSQYYRQVATEVEFPKAAVGIRPEALDTIAPSTLVRNAEKEIWNLSLEEAVALALANSDAIRELGGRVMTAPDSINSIYNPAITETDPRLGVEAALSAFDAQATTSLFWSRNDRALNNIFQGAGTSQLTQESAVFLAEISKRTAGGTQFFLRNNTEYDGNNSPQNLFPSAWNTNVEMEFRHPLLQGGGIEFNRIAGPNATPGSYSFTNGVLLARVNTDVSLADFELSVRNMVSDVENAYWDLYFAYRDLDAKIVARNNSLDTWRRIYALYATKSRGGEAEKEAQAREQYYSFQSQVENALSGSPGSGTSSGNGSTGGAFRGVGGVYVSERRLRYLLGLPSSDQRLIRTSDEPSTVKVVYDWDQMANEALARRVELRRQRWQIKARELELVASRNFLLPRLDVVGLQRWRGFGDHLIDPSRQPGPFDNAVQDLTGGDYQEWQVGFQLEVPIGYRQAMAGVRNAQTRLARERAVLGDQELKVTFDLADAVGEMDRAYVLLQTNFNRRIAAQQQLEAVEIAYKADAVPLDQLLDAQRQLAEADAIYYRSLVEYNLAVKNVHVEKGSLLEYNGVYLAEGPWPKQAYQDAYELSKNFRNPKGLNYRFAKSNVVSSGTYAQSANTTYVTETPMEVWEGGPMPQTTPPTTPPTMPPRLPSDIPPPNYPETAPPGTPPAFPTDPPPRLNDTKHKFDEPLILHPAATGEMQALPRVEGSLEDLWLHTPRTRPDVRPQIDRPAVPNFAN